MNRRQFFGMTATALAAAGLPALLLPERTIFLPPTGGWFQTPLRMREVRRYLINNDSFPTRYDVAWGVEHWHVDFPEIKWSLERTDPKLFAELLEHQRLIARQTFERIRREHGYSNADQRELKLPLTWSDNSREPAARYV